MILVILSVMKVQMVRVFPLRVSVVMKWSGVIGILSLIGVVRAIYLSWLKSRPVLVMSVLSRRWR